MNERIDTVVTEYMRAIFYFAVRKTPSVYDAEDLTQEIMLEIVKALAAGVVPNDTRAWVWKIARNRYARWAKRQRRARAVADIDELAEAVGDGSDLEDDLIGREELAALRRELSLLAREHRTIVCEYYLNNRSLADIAASLGLPLGTVKFKIFECRKNIGEGMKMSREYGKRSFAPEYVDFYQNWNLSTGDDGTRYINRLAPVNILLEAYDNPCTAQDLSLALGISMPYMEEEIKLLLEGELLIKDGDKYKTNIVILSKEAQDELYNAGNMLADKLAPIVMKAVDEISHKSDLPRNQCFEDMKPTLMTLLLENIKLPENNSMKTSNRFMFKHKDGSEWALIGMVKTDRPPRYLEEWGDDDFDQIIALGNRAADSSLDIDKADIPRFSRGELPELCDTLFNSQIIELLTEYDAKKAEILRRDIPKYLYKTAMFFGTVDFRRLCLDYAIECGYIRLAADMTRSAMGVWKYNAE